MDLKQKSVAVDGDTIDQTRGVLFTWDSNLMGEELFGGMKTIV